MTLLLRKQNVKPEFGEDLEGQNIYVVDRCQVEEVNVLFSVPTIQNPAGNNTRIDLTWSLQDLYRIEGLNLEFEIRNTSATESPTFMHAIASYFADFKLLINKVEVVFHKDRAQLICAVANNLRLYDESRVYHKLQQTRMEVGKTLVGENVPVSSSVFASIDLFLLFPFLRGFIPNVSGIQRLELEINFANNTSSLLNGLFVRSNTTSNAYGSNLEYRSIKIRQQQARHSDARLYKNVFPVSYLLDKFETKLYNHDWTVGGQPLNVDLNLAFAKRKKIVGLHIFIQRPAEITAYNDSDCGKFYSGNQVIAYRILSKSKEIIKHDVIGENRKDRIKYSLDTNKRRWGTELPFEILTLSTDLGRLYIPETFIDLTNIQVAGDDEFAVSGYNNSERDIEVELVPAQTVGANSQVYVVAQYQELMNIDPKSGIVRILS